MALTDLLKNVGRALTLTAALYSCGGEEKEGCSTDYDCREPRVCVRGYCEGGNGSEGEGEPTIIGDNSDGRCGNSPFNDRYLNQVEDNCSVYNSSRPNLFNADTCTVRFYKGQDAEYSGTRVGSCNLIQNFSCSDTSTQTETCERYQCAFSRNLDLYVSHCGGGLDFGGNIFRVSDRPLTEASCEELFKESWYTDCLEGTSL